MKKILVRAGTLKIARKNKPDTGDNIVSKMKNNSNFPDSETHDMLEALTAASENLRVANTAASTRDKVAVAKANEKALVWDEAMDAVVLYVQGKANADPLNAKSIILSSGLNVRKTPAPQPAPEAPKNVDAIFTNEPGKILVEWKNPKYSAHSYVYMSATPDVENSWVMVKSLQGRQLLVNNLVSGKRYYFKVVAANRKNEASTPSDIASSIAG